MSDWISKYLQQVIDDSRKLAAETGEQFFGPMHLLVCVLRQPQNVAKRALASVGCRTAELGQTAEAMLAEHRAQRDALTQNKLYRMAMAQTATEAGAMRCLYLGTEHLIIALAALGDGQTRDLLNGSGATADSLRVAVDHILHANPVIPKAASMSKSSDQTRAPEPVGAYPPCRRLGNLLFISGQGPRQRGSKEIPGVKLDAAGKMVDYDMEAQVRAVMQNVRYILEENGSSWERIVDVTSFLTNMERDFAVYNRVYAEYFPPGPNQPCRTTLGIASLPQAGNAPIAFEVKVVAEVGVK